MSLIHDQLWQTRDNQWLTLSGNASFICDEGKTGGTKREFTLAEFQEAGMEAGSSVGKAPTPAEAVRLGVALLRLPTRDPK